MLVGNVVDPVVVRSRHFVRRVPLAVILRLIALVMQYVVERRTGIEDRIVRRQVVLHLRVIGAQTGQHPGSRRDANRERAHVVFETDTLTGKPVQFGVGSRRLPAQLIASNRIWSVMGRADWAGSVSGSSPAAPAAARKSRRVIISPVCNSQLPAGTACTLPASPCRSVPACAAPVRRPALRRIRLPTPPGAHPICRTPAR
jgi:hypothetical protein